MACFIWGKGEGKDNGETPEKVVQWLTSWHADTTVGLGRRDNITFFASLAGAIVGRYHNNGAWHIGAPKRLLADGPKTL